ncbi:MAG: nucleotide exchange factor GrpE [Selenomonas sp.]|nr:nucleotide exchange factor GrpE [Selenomonas sp.]
MPSFMKDELKKKDEQKLEEMQQEINAADSDEADEAEAASESAETEAENKDSQDEAAAQIEKLTAELKEKEDRVLRLQADFENFRRRTSKEKEELSAVVTQGMLKDMLPLLDNFERAMAAEAKDGEAFQKGVEMIFTQFTVLVLVVE